MLNKEALTRLNAPQYHFKFRVGNDPSHDWDRGWVKETKGVYPATSACHHEHIEKYITHWLYRFPSKAPNGGLIRKYLLNLGVTSQLEVPYAA